MKIAFFACFLGFLLIFNLWHCICSLGSSLSFVVSPLWLKTKKTACALLQCLLFLKRAEEQNVLSREEKTFKILQEGSTSLPYPKKKGKVVLVELEHLSHHFYNQFILLSCFQFQQRLLCLLLVYFQDIYVTYDLQEILKYIGLYK